MKNFMLNEIHPADDEFLARKELVRQYLNVLDVDRLMHTFKRNAGIASDAEPLGGWESPEWGLRGHFVGQLLLCMAIFCWLESEKNQLVST